MLKIAGHDGNAELDAMPISDTLSLYDGTEPASCEDPANGTLLISFPLASPWALPAARGFKHIAGLPLDADVVADGVARYFRFELRTYVSGDISGDISGDFMISGDSPICNMQGLCGIDLIMGTYEMATGDTHTLEVLPFVAYNDDEFVSL